jgi:outer membrane protein TolC
MAGPDFESDGGDKSTGVALEMELPIFRDGSAEVRAAMAERDAARARFEARLLTAQREIRARRAALDAARRSETRHRTLVAGTVGVGEAALRRRLNAGESNMIDAAVLLASLAAAVQRGVSLEEGLALARLELAAAKGTLTEPTSADEVADEGGAR